MDLSILVATFDDEATAGRALATLIPGLGTGGVAQAAVVAKLDNGKVRFIETHDSTTGQGALKGAYAGALGGLVGILFTPVALIAAPVGAAVGAIVGKFRDSGYEDDELKGLGEDLAPGQSALIANIGPDKIESAKRLLAEVGVQRIVITTLGSDLAAILDAEAGDLEITPDPA